MHYGHAFHPAGHGTFFSGAIRSEDSDIGFVWVYDCGSKRPSNMRGLVDDFADQMPGHDQIDLLCLSHFDSDHVVGMDLLLDRFGVGILVLPYLHLADRLRLACSVIEEEQHAAGRLAAFTASPLTYLRRGGDWRVGRVILVQGGPSSEETTDDGPREDRDPEHLELKTPLVLPAPSDVDRFEPRRMPAGVVSHSRPWRVSACYEFMFYNAAWPNGQAPHSGVALADIALQVDNIIDQYRLLDHGPPQAGWLAALKALYSQHFGPGKKRRNDISLCVHGRPLSDSASCKIFHRKNPPFECIAGDDDPDRGNGILLTGDIGLNRHQLETLRDHLGMPRWQNIRVMQIPHHGSRDNWQAGNSAICHHQTAVICAPEPTRNGHHPHRDVLNDLPEYEIASYERGLHFDCHNSK